MKYFILLFCLANFSFAQSWSKDPEKAFKDAEKNSSPLIIDFYAEWCAPCKKMDQTTLQDESVLKELKNYTLLKVDAEKFRDISLKYEVSAYPTFILLNKHLEVVSVSSGFQNAETFSKWLISNNEQAFSTSSLAELDEKDKKYLSMIKENKNRQAAFEALVDQMFSNEYKKKKLFAELNTLVDQESSSCFQFLNHESLNCRLVSSMLYKNLLKEKFDFDPWSSSKLRIEQLNKMKGLLK
ncbi:MAG: thioredoxin domain-containing protein [Lentisphaeraceae bacterium]|nr:thioredoxin domain-containing protein [Lentisphaeraceae bacterium]